MKMNASEMFERLGYKRTVESKKIIYFNKFEGSFYYDKVEFDLLNELITIDNNFEILNIDSYMLQAIDKQAEELGWLCEKTCTNESEYNLEDLFKCSNCGIELGEYRQFEIDEDYGDRYGYQYRPKYCPNCGRKIVD